MDRDEKGAASHGCKFYINLRQSRRYYFLQFYICNSNRVLMRMPTKRGANKYKTNALLTIRKSRIGLYLCCNFKQIYYELIVKS